MTRRAIGRRGLRAIRGRAGEPRAELVTASDEATASAHSVVLLAGLLSIDECARLLNRATAAGFAPARLTSQGRFNHETFFVDRALSDCLKHRLGLRLPVLEVDDVFEIYRYAPGQSISLHEDAGRPIRSFGASNGTLLTYLSDSFEGGRTLFPTENLKIEPQLGQSILFRHHLPHAAEIVRSGTKFVSRLNVAVRW